MDHESPRKEVEAMAEKLADLIQDAIEGQV